LQGRWAQQGAGNGAEQQQKRVAICQ
jgi:hypothetical protein